jgi:C-terminal processing protease CtpA/Prc
VIVSVNMRSVDSPEQLADVIGSRQAGDEVAIRIVRNGERRTVDVTLSARDETDSSPQLDKKESDSGDKEFDKKLDSDIEKSLKGLGDVEVPEAPEAPIPSRDEIRKMIRDSHGQVRTFESSRRARLGVRVDDSEEGSRNGAVITEVLSDSPAERAGLREGDVITEIDGKSIDNSGDLIDTVRGKDGRIDIEYYRRDVRHNVQVLLETPRSGGSGGPRVYSWQGDDGRPMFRKFDEQGSDELRKQIDDLREEIRQLRRELDELKRGR